MLRIMDAELSRQGHEPTRWDLGERPVPAPDPEYHRDPLLNPDPEVHRLVLAADAAQAFVLTSPNYHNSFSGLLKDALDNMSVPQFNGKSVGLGSNGGGIPPTRRSINYGSWFVRLQRFLDELVSVASRLGDAEV